MYPEEELHLLRSTDSSAESLYTLDRTLLACAVELAESGDPVLAISRQALIAKADSALEQEPLTIVTKPQTPSSGDRHDYMSMGPYWWPNPATDDGLPYIRKDGEVNPLRNEFDRPKLGRLNERVNVLGLAYAWTGDERYAEHAALLLRTWFLDVETRMNPNLKYGQAIPGICEGRGIGLIETADVARRLVPAVGLIASSDAWSDTDHAGLRAWFSDFLTWMFDHEYGVAEARTKNNHATAYDFQVASYALFIGRGDVAEAVLNGVGERRIAPQIEPDGQQPHELARTKALSYSSGNLGLFLGLAWIARPLGTDLTAFETADGRSIRKALDWLVPYWTGESQWTHDQIAAFGPEGSFSDLRYAAYLYNDERYESAIERVSGMTEEIAGSQLLNCFVPPYS